MWYHWVIFGLIFLIVPFSLTYFFNTVLKNIELTEEQKTHKNLTIGVYILLSWLYDLLYMAIFNKWVICAYIFGIIAIIISIVNITKALINKDLCITCGACKSIEFIQADNLFYGISSTYEDIDSTKEYYDELIAETFEDIE